MKLQLGLVIVIVRAAVLSPPKPSQQQQSLPQGFAASPQSGSGGQQLKTSPQQAGSKQIAESKAARVNNFLGRIQERVNKAEASVQARKGAPPKAKKLSKAERKAAKARGKADARKRAQQIGGEGEDLLSLSASASVERIAHRNSHFSFSESEHYRDCSTTSSSSNERGGKCNGKKPRKKKTGYRLRHVRVHAEQSRARKLSASASISASVEDLFNIDGSGSLSASAEFSRRRRTVLKCCEDELARKRKRCGRRGSDPYARVDYRKKVFFDDDAARKASISASLSVSIEQPDEAGEI